VVYDHLIPDQERYYAGLVARALDLPHEIQPADEFDLFDWAEDPVWGPPEPVNEPCWAWNVRYLHQLASACPLVLTGNDGDSLLMADLKVHWRELLQGGRLGQLVRDLAWYVATQRSLPPVGFRTYLKRRLRRLPPRLSFPVWLNPDFSRRADLPARWAACTRPRVPATARGLALEHLAAPVWASVFDDYDASWTGSPLEVCHPLMDVRLVTFLVGLPAVPWCVHKELFRRALRPLVPPEVYQRPKTVLVEDPVQVKLHQQGISWGKTLAWEPEIARFIKPNMLAQVPQTANVDETYCWLRPFNLNLWLKSQKRKARTT
jgi:asparagine synthase (glutamine-hydrolysing)